MQTTCQQQQQQQTSCQQQQEQKEKVSFETVKAQATEENGYYLEQHFTSCLAQYAYYIESQGEACIIDPMREIDQYLDIINRRKSNLKYIMNTHFHADFVSGHFDLAAVTKAQIVYGPQAQSEEEIIVAYDNQEFKLGKIIIKVLHTPGHTLESSSYLLIDESGKQRAVFTGDTVFMGDVGRPDLAVSSNITKEDLAGMLFDSIRNKIITLGEDVALYPGHGAGSACGKNIQSGNSSTIGKQILTNYALAQDLTKEEFVKKVTAEIPQPPKYFPENAKMNKQGYTNIFELIKKSTTSLNLELFENEVKNGAIIIDSRKVCDYLNTGIIPGSVCLSHSFPIAVWLGTLMDITEKYVLVTDKVQQKEIEIATRFARVGFENLLGFLEGGLETWVNAGKQIEKIEFIEAKDLKNYLGKMPIVDVRKTPEYNKIHLENVILAPMGVGFMNEEFKKVPRDQDILIHCKSGLRSIAAISILRRMGYKNRMIEIKGGMDVIEKEEGINFIKQ